jgi:glycosyltransferase involved in cell wall biosynthesis
MPIAAINRAWRYNAHIMPKLLYLITEDWFFVSHFLPMAQVARECGFEVAVATRVRDAADQIKASGISVIPIEGRRGSFSPLAAFSQFIRVMSIVRTQRPDIVHCIALQPIMIGGVAARLAGAKALVVAPTGLGYLWLKPGIMGRLLRGLVRFVVGSLLHGRSTRYLFENREDPVALGLDPDAPNITIVGGAGVEPSEFSVSAEPPAPPIRVAVVARMIWPKGIGEAVAAVRRARALGAQVELDLYGQPDPSNPKSIPEETLRDWSSLPGIAWRGHTRDIAAVWRDHHVALFLSAYPEGLPRTLVEAAAAGRPIVTTDVTGCREVVRDGVEGFLVPPGDEEAAARALVKLATDPALRARLGAAARARFEERFTAEAVKRKVRDLYRSLGATPAGRSGQSSEETVLPE